MAKYLVETYYTCSFKVSHYLDDIDEKNIQNIEKRDDGKFEILDVKLDNRKTKNLEKIDKNKINVFDRAWISSSILLIFMHMVDIQYFDARISIVGWILLSGLKNITTYKEYGNNLNKNSTKLENQVLNENLNI